MTTYSTIDKLVVVGIARYQVESPYWCNTNEIPLVEKGLNDGIGKKSLCRLVRSSPMFIENFLNGFCVEGTFVP